MSQLLTLVFFVQDKKILLGFKKRGFGAGRFNGFGGKVQPEEELEDAAKREAKEECGLDILGLEKRAIHQFSFKEKPEETLEVHTFLVTKWTGIPQETEEMKPEWFTLDTIPYDVMWPDDILWLPQFLTGKILRTSFLFGEEDRVLEYEVKEVTTL